MSADFIYTEVAKAEADLVQFSKMFCNEDKPLYLIAVGGWQITHKVRGIVEAMAINGVMYRLTLV